MWIYFSIVQKWKAVIMGNVVFSYLFEGDLQYPENISLKYDVVVNLRAALWGTGEPELPTRRGWVLNRGSKQAK